MAKIKFPWNNLGCLGIEFKDETYWDINRSSGNVRIFNNDRVVKRWYRLKMVWELWPFSLELTGVDVVDVQAFHQRVKWKLIPGTKLLRKNGELVETAGFPYISDNCIMLHVRPRGNRDADKITPVALSRFLLPKEFYL